MTHRPPKSVDDVTSTTFGRLEVAAGAWVLLLLRLTGLKGRRY